MEIERARPDDIGRIAALEKEIFPDPWSEESIRALILSELSLCFVARRDGELVGYFLGSCIVPEGELFRLAVDEGFRRRGIGYRLLDGCIDRARAMGVELMFLEVRSKNLPARALYRALGFCEDGVRRSYYKNPSDDAILMHLDLTKGSMNEHSLI